MSIAPVATPHNQVANLAKSVQTQITTRKPCSCSLSNIKNDLEKDIERCIEVIELAEQNKTFKELYRAAIIVAKIAEKLIEQYAPNTEMAAIANEIDLIKQLTEEVIQDLEDKQKLEADLPNVIALVTKIVDFAIANLPAISKCTIQ